MHDRSIAARVQSVDPLTALKYAVQVMNLLNMLIERALKHQQPSPADHGRHGASSSSSSSSSSAAAGGGGRRP